MAEMKNICGKIPLELHEKVRQEIEETESSTQKFIQQVIEEHFMRKGAVSMEAVRTVAVQVSEELFGRLKAVLARKGCKQKDFLIGLIEQALEAEEARWRAEAEAAEEERTQEENEAEEEETEAEEAEAGEEEPEAEETEADGEESEAEEAEADEEEPEAEEAETDEETEEAKEEAETEDTQDSDDTEE